MNIDEALGGTLCPLCGHDNYLEVTADTGTELEIMCRHRGEGREWTTRQRRHHAPLGPTRGGYGEQLGLYDDLQEILVVGEPYLEYGVVEHRYAEHNSAAYEELVGSYSHTAYGPTRYSASVFIGRALWTLQREGVLERISCPATGYWEYNHRLSAWAKPPVQPDAGVLSWADFAFSIGAHPKDWPALGYVAPLAERV